MEKLFYGIIVILLIGVFILLLNEMLLNVVLLFIMKDLDVIMLIV